MNKFHHFTRAFALSTGMLAATLTPAPASAQMKFIANIAMEMMAKCMKMKAASPEQKKCIDDVKKFQVSAMTQTKQLAAAKPAPAPAAKAAPATAGAAKPAAGAAPAAKPTVMAGDITPTISGAITMTNFDPRGMDLETAMFLVQTRRAEQLEGLLKTQIDSVELRNKEISDLNKLIADLNALRPAGNDPEKWANLGADQAAGRKMHTRIKDAALPMPTGADEVNEPGTNIYDAKQKTFDAWTAAIKSKLDELNNTQQMDMLRMQSLSNKRNEAFEIMTNFLKKLSENRSSIIGNMRDGG